MELSEQQQTLVAFSSEIADSIMQFMELYPSLYGSVVYLSSAEPSPVVESQMIDLRNLAGNLAYNLTLFSRTIDSSASTFSDLGIDAKYHPSPVRGVLQEMAESCVLLSRVLTQREMGELPLVRPETLSARLEKPQIAAWMEANRPDPQTQAWRQQMLESQEPVDAGPAVDPSYLEPPAPLTPQQNPYPPTDPSDPPPVSAPPVPEQPVTPLPEPTQPDTGWQSGEPPQGLPGDRRR